MSGMCGCPQLRGSFRAPLPGQNRNLVVRHSRVGQRMAIHRSGRFVQYRIRCAAETEKAEDPFPTPPGCSRYQVTLSKPLGLVLEEDKQKNIYVAEVPPGGNGEKCGQISPGDQLISTSGVIYTTGQTYGETFVKGGEQIVQMNVIGENFDAVLAAIGSHPAHVPVKLEFQRCE